MPHLMLEHNGTLHHKVLDKDDPAISELLEHFFGLRPVESSLSVSDPKKEQVDEPRAPVATWARTHG